MIFDNDIPLSISTHLKASFYQYFLVLPKDGPKITGGKDRYSVGDTVNVNCTSKASKPAADIQWIINGKAVSYN